MSQHTKTLSSSYLSVARTIARNPKPKLVIVTNNDNNNNKNNKYMALSILNPRASKNKIIDLSHCQGFETNFDNNLNMTTLASPTKNNKIKTPAGIKKNITRARKEFNSGNISESCKLLIEEKKSHKTNIIVHSECFDKVQVDYPTLKQLAFKFSNFDSCSNHKLVRAMGGFSSMDMGSKHRCLYRKDEGLDLIIIIKFGLHDDIYRFGGCALNDAKAAKYWKVVEDSIASFSGAFLREN